MEPGKIRSRNDGFELAASVFRPEGAPRATVLIGSATGVPRRFYRKFAEHLSGAGLLVVTFDYRGIGESRPASLRGFAASMHVWGENDLSAALAFTHEHAPEVPRLYVGHSVGGQILPLAPESASLAAALFVAAQSGWWRHFQGAMRPAMLALWYAGIPAVTAVAGYLPMLSGGEDLPKGVAREWARWGRDRRYVLSYPGAAERFARLTLPIRDYAIGDDAYAPRPAIDALLSYYANAKTEVREVSPRFLGAKKMGHFGFFKERFRETLWTEARDWLLEPRAAMSVDFKG